MQVLPAGKIDVRTVATHTPLPGCVLINRTVDLW